MMPPASAGGPSLIWLAMCLDRLRLNLLMSRRTQPEGWSSEDGFSPGPRPLKSSFLDSYRDYLTERVRAFPGAAPAARDQNDGL
jgi:hypothetical protein